jgi:hypothetical protein
VGALLVHLGHVGAWWVLPPGVVMILAVTLRRATRAAARAARTARVPVQEH